MSNSFYNHTTYPTPNAPGSSAAMRAEMQAIAAGFDKLPALSGNANKLVVINSAGTAMVTTSAPQSLAITNSTINSTPIGGVTPSTGSFTTLLASGTVVLGSSVTIAGGTINGTQIGNSTPAAGAFTTLSASSGLTGNVTGNVTGNLTGNVTGNLTGNVTGNVTANSGTSTFSDVTITGTLNMDAGTVGTITNLSTPTNSGDASTKGYTDTQRDTRLALAGGTMSGAIAMGTNRISGLGDPVNPQDATTKSYVDNAVQGLDAKASVRAATTANITLSGTQTIDGVAVSVGNRVLVKNQSSAAENGIYVVASGSWTRTDDASTWDELVSAYTFVEQGTANGDNGFTCTVNTGGTLGSTAVTWVQFSGAGQIDAGAGLTKTGNQLNVGTASSDRIVVNGDNLDLATTGITANTYRSVTIDAYGRATAGTNPTTLAGYGITDAYTQAQTDTLLAGKLSLSGGTMSGAIAMGFSRITNLGDPVNDRDATTKAYTDSILGSATSAATSASAAAASELAAQGYAATAQAAATDPNVVAVASNIANINTVAGISSNVSTVAGISSNVTTVAGISSNVTTVANNSAAVVAVASDIANINTAVDNLAIISAAPGYATAAADSASAAAATYDAFDDRYLGAKSSNPTVDNDGNALITGALYFNTDVGEMRVYNGTAWTSAGSSVNGTSVRQSFTATAGQTTFTLSGPYDAGFADVYLNGVKLVNGVEVDVTSGTNVVLSSGATEGDSVDVVAYGSFSVAGEFDAYTKTESDALLAAKQATLVSGTNIKTINSVSLLGSGNISISTTAPNATASTTGGLFGIPQNNTSTTNAGGYGNVAIGFSVVLSGNQNTRNNVVVGNSARTSSYENVAIGYSTDAQSELGIAVGNDALIETNSAYAVVIGANATVHTSSSGKIAIGRSAGGADSSGRSIAIGYQARTSAYGAIRIGEGGYTRAQNTISIGYDIDDDSYASIVLNNTNSSFTVPSAGFYVTGVTSGTTSDVLYFDASTKKITYGAAPTGGGSDPALDDLTDVVITSPSAGQVLKFNGTNWVNAADEVGSSGGGGGGGGPVALYQFYLPTSGGPLVLEFATESERDTIAAQLTSSSTVTVNGYNTNMSISASETATVTWGASPGSLDSYPGGPNGTIYYVLSNSFSVISRSAGTQGLGTGTISIA